MSARIPGRILVAVDGSDRAAHVLEAAAALAKASGASGVVLRVVGVPVELPTEALAIGPDGLLAQMLETARETTTALRDAHAAGFGVRVVVGTAVPTILEVAEAEGADLIVIGAHGYRFGERVLGTTASRVVDRSTRSVLVVR